MQPSQPAAGSPLKERFVLGRPNFPRRSVIVATLAVTLTAAPVSLVLGDTLNVPGDFPSIQAAHDAATSGDTILVAPGTYVGSLTISKAITLGSHFITTGDPSFITSTILDGGNGSFVITIPSSAGDRPTIQGLTIQNAGDGISPNAKFNLLNNVIRDTSDGVDYEDGSGGLAQFNIFEQNGDDGIDLDNDVDIVIADNIIRNNGDDGIEIRMQSYNGPTLNIIIERNVIHDNGEDGIQLIHYDVLTDRFIEIRNNTIYNSNDVGIGMMDGSNTSEDFRAASIPERINIFNNTFRNNRYGITGGDNTVVVNNIFVDYPVIAVKNVDGNSSLAFNLFFNNGTDNSGSNVDEGSSLFVDPVLDSNLALLPGSPAIDSGTASYVWQGMTVLDLPASAYSGAAPDIGAFELESGNGPPPDPPILLLPLDGASNVGLTPTLQWSGEGTQFTVQIATDAGFVSPVDVASVSVTQYTVTQGTLEHLATYFWRVDASDANGTSDFSATWSFTTEAAASPPEPPILVAPPNGATSVPVGATLQWAGTADDFDVEVAADSSFTSVVHSANTASSSMTLPASALAHETQYYWHVRGNNAFGVGSFSATSSFTTVAPPDTIPPSKPQNLSSPDQTGTTIDLVWDPSTDNVGVSFYRIYRDNVLVASESSAQHTAVGLTPGTPYDFEVSAVDDAGLESQRSDTLTVTTLDFSDPVTVAIRVGSSSDDAEERDSGGMRMDSSDLELVYDSGNQTVGMRFNGVGIPRGAWIVHATIQFQVDEVSVGATSLAIQGEDIDHASTFANVSGNISSRARTSASVPWIPAPWPTVGQAGPDQQTPDIASVIQEIVNRPSWAAGNSLVIIITGNGERGAESFDGVPSAAPLLIVEYAEGGPPGNTPPTVDAGLPQTITLPATASLDGTVTDDGLPDPPGSVTTSWSELSGPGTVSFSDSSAVDTTASFSEAGTYVLRLTADDGALSAFADVTVTVEPEPVINEPPSVSAGVPQTITLPATASLDGTVTDDGLPDPPGSVTTSWSELSGPGTVSF
ncbi:MAG TPA: right-handed parallel beta-helix repeat-containing protein, partial [Vicinamibacteria bacterium]|nr:right-handed parallel beta-helix repeat-containing protein [Vicinamibacteria bacterium]